uniref:YadA-like family protein n=1 Tax=Caballeronia arvi TaxID=1777135 RepID=UPI002E159D39
MKTAPGNPQVSPGSNSVALGVNSVDDGRPNVVSVGSPTSQRQVINVAPGTEGTDAVNLDQLNGLSTSVSKSLSNQQGQINSLNAQLNQTQQALQQTDTMARQGVAAATALTMVPQVEPGKRISVGFGVGRFAGQSGMAFGASAHITSSSVIKLGIGMSGSNKTYGAGYGLNW